MKKELAETFILVFIISSMMLASLVLANNIVDFIPEEGHSIVLRILIAILILAGVLWVINWVVEQEKDSD